MAISVVFYGDNLRVDSTQTPTATIKTLNCNLKEPTGQLAPVLKIRTTEYTNAFRYAYIAKWGRWYSVGEPTFDTGNCCFLPLRVDALKTYKTQIGNGTFYINYGNGTDNVLLDDSRFTGENSVEVYQTAYSLADRIIATNGDPVYYVTCAGITGLATYKLTRAAMASLQRIINEDENIAASYADLNEFLNKSYGSVKAAITGCYTCPYVIPDLDDGSSIFISLGNQTLNKTPIPYAYWHTYNGELDKFDFYMVAKQPRTDWTANRVRFFLFLPLYGTVELPAATIRTASAASVHISYIFNPTTCELTIELENGNGINIGQYITNIGTDTGFTTTYKAATDKMLNKAASLVSLGASAAAKNPTAIIQSGINTVQTFHNSKFNSMEIDQTTGINAAYKLGNTAILYSVYESIPGTETKTGSEQGSTYTYQAITDAHRFNYGVPICERKQISSLNDGFTQCAGASFAYGTQEEKEQVNAWLNNGFLYVH